MLIERRRGEIAALYARRVKDLQATEAAVHHEIKRGRRCHLFCGVPQAAQLAASIVPDTSGHIVLIPEKAKASFCRAEEAIGAALLALHADLTRADR